MRQWKSTFGVVPNCLLLSVAANNNWQKKTKTRTKHINLKKKSDCSSDQDLEYLWNRLIDRGNRILDLWHSIGQLGGR